MRYTYYNSDHALGLPIVFANKFIYCLTDAKLALAACIYVVSFWLLQTT